MRTSATLFRRPYIPVFEAFLIGCVAGLSAVCLGAGVNWLGRLRVYYSDLLPASHVLPLFGLVGGLLAGLMIQLVAPEASGSGIPQVRAALSRIRMPLDFRIAIVKLLGGTVALGSGLFLGREGPTVQLGASLAAPLSRLTQSATAYRRQLIAAGAGAGLTAAFNAPLAGTIFIMEELLKEINSSTILIAVIACGAASLVLNIFSYQHMRTVLSPPSGNTSLFGVDLPYYLLLGVACGGLGAIFNASIIGSLNCYQKLKRVPVCIRISIAGFLSGCLMSCFPDSFHNYARVRWMFASVVHPGVAAVVFVEFFLLTMIAYGSGAPGGLFAPTLVLGSAVGYLVGHVEHALTGSTSFSNFALVGMGAFFSGVARVPLTAVAITFELTNNYALVAPLMIACVIASAIGDALDSGSIYDQLMAWNGINLRPPDPEHAKLVTIQAKDVMQTLQTEVLSSNTPLKEVLQLFGHSTIRGLPVVDKYKLVGVLSQSDMTQLLESDKMSAEKTVRDIMTPFPVAVSPQDSLEDILHLFTRYKYTWLPVADENRFHGIINQTDVVQALFTAKEMESGNKEATADQ